MRTYLYLTVVYGFVIIILHAVSRFFSPLTSWGFYHLNELPASYLLAVCFLAGALCLPPVNNAAFNLLIKLGRTFPPLKFDYASLNRLRPAAPLGKREIKEDFLLQDPSHLVHLLISAAAIFLFWLFRSGNLFLGDGVTVAKVARSDAALKYYVGGWAGHITSHQVLDYWLARNMHKLLAPITNFESYDSVALRSCIAGGLFVFAVLEVGHVLFEKWEQRVGFAAVLFSAGAMQLFLGYVETYSLATAVLSLFCLSTLRYARGKWPVWAPVLLLALSASLHLLTLGAGLALLAAYVFRSRESGKFRKVDLIAIAAIPLVVVGVYFLIFQLMGFSTREIFFIGSRKEYEGVFFLGLQRKGYLLERYTLFSLPHFIDIANEILLVAPFGLFLCLLALPSLRKKSIFKQPEPWILFMTAAAYLVVTLTAAPLLGARKDWDVFAPPWIFITMLGVYLLIRSIHDDRTVGGIIICITAVSLFSSIPWIYSNARVDLKRYLTFRGEGDLYSSQLRNELAIERYEQALDMNFTPELAYTVAGLQIRTGKQDEAVETLHHAIREENRSELALFLEQEDAHFALGSIYLSQQKTDEAIAEFQKALALWRFRHNQAFKHPPDVLYHLGVAYLEKGNSEAAEKAFIESIETGHVPAAHLALARIYAQSPAAKERAKHHLLIYLEENPADSSASELLNQIKAGELR